MQQSQQIDDIIYAVDRASGKDSVKHCTVAWSARKLFVITVDHVKDGD